MKFVLKFERCTSACHLYNVALPWIKLHTPVGFPFSQAEHHLLIASNPSQIYCKVKDSVIDKR